VFSDMLEKRELSVKIVETVENGEVIQGFW
jgi:hypothetical protein